MNKKLSDFIKILKDDADDIEVSLEGEVYSLNYVYIRNKGSGEGTKKFPLFLLQGFYWGYIGMSELAYYLWQLGDRDIILLSLPGYGNSKDPNRNWAFYSDGVSQEARLVRNFLGKLDVKKCIFVGHSMGALIVSTIVDLYPDLCDKIVLMSPASLIRRSIVLMPISLLWAEIRVRVMNLKEWRRIPFNRIKGEIKQRGPFSSWVRFKLRWSEYMRVSYDLWLLDIIKRLYKRKKFYCITGRRDSLFPAKRIEEALKAFKIKTLTIEKGYHNIVVYHRSKVARVILDFIND